MKFDNPVTGESALATDKLLPRGVSRNIEAGINDQSRLYLNDAEGPLKPYSMHNNESNISETSLEYLRTKRCPNFATT